ncbi:hypothetical protein D3C75_1130030 [compost metagenome]
MLVPEATVGASLAYFIMRSCSPGAVANPTVPIINNRMTVIIWLWANRANAAITSVRSSRMVPSDLFSDLSAALPP